MSQQELLIRVARELEAVQVAYMLTGSFASSLQGEPRATHDIDLVVALEAEAVQPLVKAFGQPDYYMDEQAIHRAIRSGAMFNLIETRTGDKVDFWPLTNDPFDQSRFSRRCVAEVFGRQLHVSSPEDTILAKLRWAKQVGGSEKHFGDALRVYEVQQGVLDRDYLQHWVTQLGVNELWQRMLRESEPLS